MGVIKFKFPDSVPRSHISVEFIQGMLDRMAMGYYNYGHDFSKFDAMGSAKLRVRTYRRTHNTENLMDAANYFMIEFMEPKDSKAYFESMPKSKSPGAKVRSGKIVRGKEDFEGMR